MKIQHILVGGFFMIPSLMVHAQQINKDEDHYVTESHQFSMLYPSGTTRFQSLGGVNTALGADISSISGNPAGLGFYRKSDINITPALTFTTNKSTYINRSLEDGTTFFSVPNFGLAISGAKRDSDKSLWRGGTFGLSYTRMANFRNEVTFQGDPNRANSVAIWLRNEADKLDTPSDNLLKIPDNQIGYNVGYNEAMAQLAYKGFLIDGYDSDRDGNQDVGNYYITNLSRNATVGPDKKLIEDPFLVGQSENRSSVGNRGQWTVAWGGNWNDKVYMGASLGIATLRYAIQKNYTEVVNQSSLNYLNQFTLTDNLEIQGTGINATLGLIYRPVEWIRVGWSFSTPTIYGMREISYTSLSTIRVSGSPVNVRTVDTEFKYKLTTPLRTSLGTSIFFGKYGFVSGDIEYMPYRATRLGGSDWGNNKEGINRRVAYNTKTKQYFRNVFNYRLGAEFRYEIAYVRAGFNYQPDSYQNSVDKLNRNIVSLSGGVGIKVNNFYADLGFINTKTKGGYTPYVLEDENTPAAITKYSTNSIMLTIGSNF